MSVIVKGGGGKPEEEKTVTAGTSVIEVLPSSGTTMKKVNVNPTPTEEKTITAGTSATMVTPTSGKYIKKVTVNPTPSQSKTVTPSTSQQTVSPDSGKLLSQVIVKAMEDVTPEVTAQTPVITQIAENLGVTITTPSGTNKQILQGNNANLLNIKDNAKKTGAYVWKKLTAEGGDFIDFVVSDSESAYPDGAVHTDGYWYEKSGGEMALEKTKFMAASTSDNLTAFSVNHSFGDKVKMIMFFCGYQDDSIGRTTPCGFAIKDGDKGVISVGGTTGASTQFYDTLPTVEFTNKAVNIADLPRQFKGSRYIHAYVGGTK